MKPQDVYAKLQANPAARLLDVREPDEFKEVRATMAELFSLSNQPGNVVEAGIPTDAELYIICRSGGRSSVAIELLKAKGYTNLVNVEGGTMQWQADKLPIDKATNT